MAEIVNNIRTTLQMENDITVDGVSVKGQRAMIDSNNPEQITIDAWINNQELYKENRAKVRQLEDAFENEAYAKQDEMILVNKKALS